MFGCNCDLLPVASTPISPTSGSSTTTFFCYSHQFVSISIDALPYPPQARSILKLLSSVRGTRNLCKVGRNYFNTGFLELQVSNWKKNPLLVSLMICPVAEIEGKAVVNRENANFGNFVFGGQARSQTREVTLSIGSCPSLLALEDGTLHEVEASVSPACLENDSETEGSIDADKERLRRERISHKNKGKVPWNKGKKHSPETIERIRQRTSQAMLRPKVREKLVRNASKPMGDDIKENIKRGLIMFHAKRKELKLQQLACLENWKNLVAEAAKIGGPGEEELQWNSYSVMTINLKLEFREEIRALKRKKKEEAQELVDPKKDHRKSISEAIKAKWKDPEYRRKAIMGRQKYLADMSNLEVKIKRVRAAGSPSRTKVRAPKKLQVMKVKSKPAVQNVDTAFVAEVMWGDAQPLPKKKLVGVNGHFNRTLGDSLENYKNCYMLPLAQEKTMFHGQSLTSANGHFTITQVSEVNPEKLHSYIDSKASEKLEKLRKLQASRLAAERARLLMMEAEKAAKALEIAAESNKFAKASLDETRRLLAEAAQSIKSAESKNMMEHALMHQQKTGSNDVDSPKLSYVFSPPRSLESCTPSDPGQSFSSVEPKSSSNSEALVDAFDLVDSWILHENPETSRKSPSKSMRKTFRPEKHSLLPNTPNDELSNAVRLTNLTDRSSPCSPHLQNLKDCHSILPKGIPEKIDGAGINWNIQKQVKGLKKWHCGRLLAVENKGSC